MAVWIAVLLGILFSIIAIIGTVLFFILTWKSAPSIKLEPNMGEVFNLMPQFTNGHARGLEFPPISLKNGNMLCRFYPTDQQQSINPEKNKPPKIQMMVVGRGHRISLAKGDLSSYRDTIIYDSKNPQDLPKKLQEIGIGKILSEKSIYQKIMNNLNRGILEGDKAQAHIIKEWGKAELSREHLKKLEDIKKIEDRLSGIEKKEEKVKSEKTLSKPL